jgi:hypothetical protein
MVSLGSEFYIARGDDTEVNKILFPSVVYRTQMHRWV